MSMTEGEIYRCQNRRCGCEIVVVKPSTQADVNPRCCCGSEMKKPYTKPVVFRQLEDQSKLTPLPSRTGTHARR